MGGKIGLMLCTKPRVCSICGEEFLAKTKRTQVCYEEECQDKAKKERDRKRYARNRAAKRVESDVGLSKGGPQPQGVPAEAG